MSKQWSIVIGHSYSSNWIPCCSHLAYETMNKSQFYYTLVFSIFLTSLLFCSCKKTNEMTEYLTPFTRVIFTFPNDDYRKYEVKVDGKRVPLDDWGHGINMSQRKEKIDVEVSLNGSVIYSQKGMKIPEDKEVTFYFTKILGYEVVKNVPEEQRHKMLITILNPFEGMSIVVKGIDGKPEGVDVTSGQEYTLDQADIDRGDVTVEVYNGDKLLYSSPIATGSKQSVITLAGDSESLTPITPPTEEMRQQIRPNTHDCWVSFMYASKDYPDIESMILEVAPSNYFENTDWPEEGKFSPEHSDGPIKIELLPDTPSKYILINTLEKDFDALWINRLYDAKDPEHPLVRLISWKLTYIFDITTYAQGEKDFKFRTYRFIPQSSPDYPPEQVGSIFEHYPKFMKEFAF